MISSSAELRINIELEICKVNHLPELVVDFSGGFAFWYQFQ
jgi:hypothetical protein